MQRNVRRAAVLLVLAAAGGGQQQPSEGSVRAAPPGATSNLAIPASSFRAEFDAVLAGIDEHYALKEVKGIDVGALRARFGPDVDTAATPEAFYATLVRVFASLRNSHSDLLLPSRS